MKVCLLIPTLNEAESLPHILPAIDPTWVDEIILVDGGSKDDTVKIAEAWGHAKVVRQKLRGLSNAYWESFPHITSDVIITFSPDGNSLPEAIPLLIAKMREGYDMVIASRYLPGAGSEDDDAITGFGNWMFTAAINFLFGARITDSLVMLRAYRTALIDELPMEARDPVFEPQMAIRCAVQRRRVTEIPAKEPLRIGGHRKMQVIYNGTRILLMVLREWVRMLNMSRPRRAIPGPRLAARRPVR